MNKAIILLGVGGALAAVSLSGCGRPASAGPRPQQQLALDIRKALSEGAAEVAGSASSEPTGTGWGTLRGRFKYVGTAPARARLNADKDTAVCGAHGPLLDHSLLVDSDGGIANV